MYHVRALKENFQRNVTLFMYMYKAAQSGEAESIHAFIMEVLGLNTGRYVSCDGMFCLVKFVLT